MRSCYFGNGVTWSYTGFEAHCSFLKATITDNMKLLKHQKLDKLEMISGNLNIKFVQETIHLTFEITWG